MEEKKYENLCDRNTEFTIMHGLWLGSLVARNKGVSMTKIGFVKLRLSKKFLRKDSGLWETTTKTWEIKLCTTGRDSGNSVNHSQPEIGQDY